MYDHMCENKAYWFCSVIYVQPGNYKIEVGWIQTDSSNIKFHGIYP